MELHQTACPLDCPDSCSLEASVENGSLLELRGTHHNPLTQGFICSKVRHFSRHLDCPERLLYPALRIGLKGEGFFERISWEEALDRIADKLAETIDMHGGEAILPLSYGGSNGLLSHLSTDRRLFELLGASRLGRTVCAAPSSSASGGLYGKMPGVALTDYEQSRLIVIWGANPSVSGIHLVPVIKKARERGARLVVLDPRRTNLAKQADLHLQLRPGTDLPVALGLIHWLFETGRADHPFLNAWTAGWEELRSRAAAWSLNRAASVAGIDRSLLERFALLYSESSPAVIRCGWGIERNRNGGSAVAAVLALPAVAGKFGVRGGGFTMSNSGAWHGPLAPPFSDGPVPQTREINMNHLGRALEDGKNPIRVLFVYCSNPAATLPDQGRVIRGMKRGDLFTVVYDQVMTDSAKLADIVLPATTFLEHRDLAKGYGASIVHRVQEVLNPRGETRPNFEVFNDLIRRLFPDEPLETLEHYLSRVLEGTGRPGSGSISWGQLDPIFPDSGFAPVQFLDSFPKTPDAKVHLCPEELDAEAQGGLYDYRPDPATEEYPLALISPASSLRVNSTFGQLHRGQVALEIHPTDADSRGIASGDTVTVFNALGEVHCLARRGDEVAPGTVVLPKGLWSHNTLNGRTSNTLVPDSLTDLGGGACFNDARVQVVKRPG